VKTADFDYLLPPERIAQHPPAVRGQSRLLHLAPSGDEMIHGHVTDLVAWLRPGDLLVFNDTKVVPARVFGQKETGGRIEVLLERALDAHAALVQVRASKAPKAGTTLLLGPEAVPVRVVGRREALFEVAFPPGQEALAFFEAVGEMPLPPYIERAAQAEDRDRYQTVFARHPGAVAAPTAGLHFNDDLLGALAKAGIGQTTVTLHVGAGTFSPVRVEDVEAHRMHEERYVLPEAAVAALAETRARGGRVVAVGTTVVRVLETAARRPEGLAPHQGETDIFIYPPFEFQVVDGLMTNFHLPQSTLLMLVSAFSSWPAIRRAYEAAVAEGYRFFSYGDAMLLWRRAVGERGGKDEV
jgi:S-adenosylmethionine:tRNA ribosyltransferase-isomerase